MKVVMLFLVAVVAVNGCDQCCHQDGTSCPTDPLQQDGSCCPADKTCCNIIQGAFGAGVWDCCLDGQICAPNPSSPGRNSCQSDPGAAPTAAPPTAGASPTAAPPSGPHCPLGSTEWDPVQYCYTGWEGNCGEGNFCSAHADAAELNSNADGFCCKVGCHTHGDCGTCAEAGCTWIQRDDVVGCAAQCDLLGTDSCHTEASTCLKNVAFNQTVLDKGTCWQRCNNEHSIGTDECRRLNDADIEHDCNTGYPSPLGLPSYAGQCSCDDGCASREGDVHGSDCCLDKVARCG